MGRLEVRWSIGTRKINQTIHLAHVDSFERKLRFVHVLRHAAAGEQTPVEVVSPLMIWTDQPFGMTRRLGAYE